MNQEARIKLEKTLRNYWKNKQRLWGLNRELELIDKEIYSLREILTEKDGLIPSPAQLSFTYGGGRGTSEFTPIERALQMYDLNQATLMAKIEELRKKKVQIRLRILQMEQSNDWIDYIAETQLDDFERLCFEKCYAYRWSNIQVGIDLKCDESTIRRTREKILLVFYEFLRIRA